VFVGCLQGGNIASSGFSDINQIFFAPAKSLMAHRSEKKIGGEARVPTVAIWIAMYRHYPVMKAHSDFIRLVGPILDPVAAIVEKLS
jgi:hypothetical protein